MRKQLLWFVLGAAACSSSTPAPETGAAVRRTVEIAGVPGRLTVNTMSSTSDVKLPNTVDEVWKALPAVFDSLGVKVSTVDPTRHIIGNEALKVRVQLGRTPLSRYIDCGQTQIGQNADSYDVLLTVLAQVQAAGSGQVSLTTTFDAAAKSIAFRQDYQRCSSKGLFETRFLDALKRQLQR